MYQVKLFVYDKDVELENKLQDYYEKEDLELV